MSTRPSTSRWNVRLSLFGLTVAAFGLLLWARLILVTGHPRIATADEPIKPQAQHQTAPDAHASAEPAPEPQTK